MAQRRYVPDDIILSILSKLPAKSVLRFSSVSQSWNAMIRTSSFVSAHRNHQIHNNKSYSQIYIAGYGSSSATMVLRSGANNQLLSCGGLEKHTVVGFCEGLICLSDAPKPTLLHIWNPAIQILKTVASPISTTNPDHIVHAFGFGFNRRSNDYTIVALTGSRLCMRNEVEIYSLAKECWRRMVLPEELQVCPIPFLQVASFKGSIYWLSISILSTCVILRFDVEEEIFHVVELPPLRYIRPREIMEVNGFLLYIEVSSKKTHVTAAWRLNEELSGWIALNVVLLPEQDQVMRLGKDGYSIMIKRTKDDRLFACDCYLDGDDLSFKLRDLKINLTNHNARRKVIHVVETLIWMDQEIKGDYKRLAF